MITVLSTPRWYPGFIVGTIFLTLALVWAPGGLAWLRSHGRASRGIVALAGAGVLLLAVVLGRAQEVQYAEKHYTRSTLFLQEGGPQKAYDFARRQHDKRIGIVGSSEIIFGQYGFYGADLTNRVQYIGQPGPDGAYRLPTSCPPVPPPDQCRRLRLPDPLPVHPGLPRRPLLVPDLCLGERATRR